MKQELVFFIYSFGYNEVLYLSLLFWIRIQDICIPDILYCGFQLLRFTISLYLSCVVVAAKKNENVNNTSNEQEEETLLKSSPAIGFKVRRLKKIYNELDNAQSDETKELIDKYTFLINKILNSLKIDVNIN